MNPHASAPSPAKEIIQSGDSTFEVETSPLHREDADFLLISSKMRVEKTSPECLVVRYSRFLFDVWFFLILAAILSFAASQDEERPMWKVLILVWLWLMIPILYILNRRRWRADFDRAAGGLSWKEAPWLSLALPKLLALQIAYQPTSQKHQLILVFASQPKPDRRLFAHRYDAAEIRTLGNTLAEFLQTPLLDSSQAPAAGPPG